MLNLVVGKATARL